MAPRGAALALPLAVASLYTDETCLRASYTYQSVPKFDHQAGLQRKIQDICNASAWGCGHVQLYTPGADRMRVSHRQSRIVEFDETSRAGALNENMQEAVAGTPRRSMRGAARR